MHGAVVEQRGARVRGVEGDARRGGGVTASGLSDEGRVELDYRPGRRKRGARVGHATRHSTPHRTVINVAAIHAGSLAPDAKIGEGGLERRVLRNLGAHGDDIVALAVLKHALSQHLVERQLKRHRRAPTLRFGCERGLRLLGVGWAVVVSYAGDEAKARLGPGAWGVLAGVGEGGGGSIGRVRWRGERCAQKAGVYEVTRLNGTWKALAQWPRARG